MPEQRSWPMTAAIVLVIGVVLAAIGAAIYGLVMWTIELVKTIIDYASIALSASLLALLAILAFTLFLHIFVMPLVSYLRYRKTCHDAIAHSFLPRYSTFLGGVSDSQIDLVLGRGILARKYFELTGCWPSRQSPMDVDQYQHFKANELPKLLLGRGRFHHLTDKMYAQLFAMYRSGGEIEKQTDRAIEAEARVRRPLWLTRRYLNIISFGYLGIKADETFYVRDVAKLKEQKEYVLKIFRMYFFTWLPAIEKDIPELDMEKDELLPPVEAPQESEDPETQEDDLVPVVEEEEAPPPLEDPLEEEPAQPKPDRAALEKEAVETANNSLQSLSVDHEGWDDPARLLAGHDAVLHSELVQQWHPDQQWVQGEMAANERRQERLQSFGAAFDSLLSQDRDVDAPWGVPWATSAAMDMEEAGYSCVVVDLKFFRRLCTRHFVMSENPDPNPEESGIHSEPVPDREESDSVPALTTPTGF
jgi:hypothetical protein